MSPSVSPSYNLVELMGGIENSNPSTQFPCTSHGFIVSWFNHLCIGRFVYMPECNPENTKPFVVGSTHML